MLGYKAFHGYLSSPYPSTEAFNKAVDEMKVATRKYARRQINWIRNKLLPAAHSSNVDDILSSIYLLDATGEHTIIYLI